MGKEKDECPHCDKPIDEDATFCPHCGSDSETGWKPDTDYYSVELPEDEDEHEEERPPRALFRLRFWAGPALVALALAFFVVYGLSRFQPAFLVLIPAVYVALTIAALAKLAPKSRGGA